MHWWIRPLARFSVYLRLSPQALAVSSLRLSPQALAAPAIPLLSQRAQSPRAQSPQALACARGKSLGEAGKGKVQLCSYKLAV